MQISHDIAAELLEVFCSSSGIAVARIPACSTKTPDYELRIGSHHIVAELKTLQPNEEEREVNARSARGEIVVGGATPGERLRREIRSANRQFKDFPSSKGVPTLLVVFNATGCQFHTEPYSVMTAMKGIDVVEVLVYPDPTVRPTFGQTRSGPDSAMRADANTSTSAVAVLEILELRDVRLDVYHNRHATAPLDPDALRISGVKQFRLPQHAKNSLDASWRDA